MQPEFSLLKRYDSFSFFFFLVIMVTVSGVGSRESVGPIGLILLNFIFCPTGLTILNAF